MPASQLGKYENGRQKPRLETLERILVAEGATLSQLDHVLAVLRKPDLARAAVEQADEIREGGGELGRGMLVPVEKGFSVIEERLFALRRAIREVVYARAMSTVRWHDEGRRRP